MKPKQANRSRYALSALCAVLSPAAFSLALDFGDGDDLVTMDIDTSVTYGAQWRVQAADKKMLRGDGTIVGTVIAANIDDGNRNFDTGLVSNRITLLTDMDIRWRDFGVFLRGKAFYDTVYKDRHTDNDATGFAVYNSGTAVGGTTAYGDFPKHTEDDYGADVRLLDAFAYSFFEMGDHLLNVRAGRQAINWGESTFYPGIMAAQNRIDVAASNVPGVEVKEILLPTGAIYGQMNLTDRIDVEAYYQYEFKRTKIDGVGSYYSFVDQMGPGGENYLAAVGGLVFAFPRSPDERPSDNGQWGMAARYLFDDGSEIAFYNLVAHAKTPSFVIRGTPIGGGLILPTDYVVRYYDEVRLYGMSFSTVIGTTSIGGELSYRPNMPVVSSSLVGTPERTGFYQASVNGTHIFGPSWLSDGTTVVFEVVTGQHDTYHDQDLRFDSAAWAASVRTEFAYNSVLPGVDLTVPVFYSQGFEGTIKEMNITEHAKVFSIGLNLLYLQQLEAGISYTTYFGGDIDNWINDRDNIALTLKYSF
ncbi:MAG: DUF1302 domain-containing protein [Gammaproteobacteria bacterium]|nr:MAG: DUF1302 domain-containing protein [Gammaproteobacteria bacterium]